jgi:hypothetical protein
MTLQGTRSDALVAEFDAACSELRTTIAGVPDDQWQVPTPGDGRPVNVVAHHAAGAHRPLADMLRAMATGQPASLSMEQIHAGNAEHARQFAACTKAEALEQHDQGAAYARAVVHGFTDAQLARHGEFLVGRPMTVEQAVQRVLINHPREHTATIQGALH